tara:strand:- start:1186 stop:1887 length:702 start_codon:yes stop_codon:yes gene_type:complete
LQCIKKTDIHLVLHNKEDSMKLLEKHFPDLRKIDGITNLSGKAYINHPGLLFLAQGKIHSKTTRMLDISNVEKGDFYFECTIVTMDGRTFNGHGNGNSGNIKGVAKNRAFEMAEVRAQNRALREMLALGDTTAEEIDEGAALHGDIDAQTRTPSEWTDLERKRFAAAISEQGMSMDIVKYMCQVMSRSAGTPPHPRMMTEAERVRVLGFIKGLTDQNKTDWVRDFQTDVRGAS